MLTVKGRFDKGVVRPLEAVEGREGQHVLITFLDTSEEPLVPEMVVNDEDTLGQLLEMSKVDTGIPDLAHQHDHYLHGTQKKDS